MEGPGDLTKGLGLPLEGVHRPLMLIAMAHLGSLAFSDRLFDPPDHVCLESQQDPELIEQEDLLGGWPPIPRGEGIALGVDQAKLDSVGGRFGRISLGQEGEILGLGAPQPELATNFLEEVVFLGTDRSRPKASASQEEEDSDRIEDLISGLLRTRDQG